MAARGRAITPGRFYSRALTEAERADLPAALEVNGVDLEIALLRLKLRAALTEHPEDLPLLLKGIEVLARVVATRYRLSKEDKRQLTDSLADLRAVAESLVLETVPRE